MSVDQFSDNPEFVKSVTNAVGDGVGKTIAPQSLGTGSPAPYYEVSVKDKPGMGSSGLITHTGPGAGTMGGSGQSTDMQGFVSATGNKILIDNTFGSDTITIQHHSGATILIDADGSIHMISTGKKGVGMISPKGDTTIYAKSHMILKADGKITIETEGDLDFNVGGNLGIHVGGDFVTSVRGSVDESVDGSKSFEVAKDMSTMVAGDNRVTSAGKMRIQSSKSFAIDAADNIDIRTDANFQVDSQANSTILAVGAIDMESKDKFIVKSQGDMTHQSKGNVTSMADGTNKLSAQGATSIHSNATLDLLGAALIQMKGAATDIQTGGSLNPDSTTDITAAPLAQYAPANTIIDSITSIRIAPDFPKNANKMSAEEFSLYKNEGGTPNPKAEAYAAPNKGAGATYDAQDSGITAEAASAGIYDRPTGSVTGNGEAVQNPLPMPSSVLNKNEKISRHLTIGSIIDVHLVPADRQKEVLTAAMNVAWNILDPLIEKFSGRVYISSWYRDAPRQNHVTGGAVDLRCVNKPDYAFTAEMAAYIRDNLPFNRLFLEKNDEGGIHCHVQSAQPGQKGGGEVFTCADPGCHQKVDGLQLSYAVAALEGRKVS